MPDDVETRRIVMRHGDQFVCSNPRPVDATGFFIEFDGYHVTTSGWYGGKRKLTVPAIGIRYIERGEYRFGEHLPEVPPLPKP